MKYSMKQDIDGKYRKLRCNIFIKLCETILSLFDDASLNLHTKIFEIRSNIFLLNKDFKNTALDFDKKILEIEKELYDAILKIRIKNLHNSYNSNSNYHIELDNHNNIINELKYERYSNVNICYLESKLLGIFNSSFFSHDLTLCVTNSGIASLLLIITLTKHHFLRYNDLILYSSGIYSSSKELLHQEYHCRLEEFNSGISENSIINLIVKRKPQLVFLDIIDTTNLKRINIRKILEYLERHYDQNIKIIIDFTLDPTFNIDNIYRQSKFVEIFLYSSLSKYFQFGFDSALMGCVISNKKYYESFDNYRVLASTILNKIYLNSIPISDKISLNQFISIIKINSIFFYEKYKSLRLDKAFRLTYDKSFKTGLFFLELIETNVVQQQIDVIVRSVVNNCNAEFNIIMYSLSYGFTRPSISVINENERKRIRLWVGALNYKHLEEIANQLNFALK